MAVYQNCNQKAKTMSTFFRVVYTLDEDFDSIEQARKFRDTLPSHANVTLKVIQDEED